LSCALRVSGRARTMRATSAAGSSYLIRVPVSMDAPIGWPVISGCAATGNLRETDRAARVLPSAPMRRLLIFAGLLFAAMALGACAQRGRLGSDTTPTARVVIASPTYAGHVSRDEQNAKLARLEAVVNQLRNDTG